MIVSISVAFLLTICTEVLVLVTANKKASIINRPKIVNDYINVGNKLFDNGYYERAMNYADAALKLSPNEKKALNLRDRADVEINRARTSNLRFKLYESVEEAEKVDRVVIDAAQINEVYQLYLKAQEAFEKKELSLIDGFQTANTAHFEKVKAWLMPAVQKITSNGGKVAVLGLSNVPGTDDLRETPAVALLKAMAESFEDQTFEGEKPFAFYLPWGMDQAKWRLFRTRAAFTFCASCAEATKNAEMVVILGAWPGMGRMLTPALAKRMAGRQIVDVTGSLDRKKIAALGLKPVGLFEKLEDLN